MAKSITDVLPLEIMMEILSYTFGTFSESSNLKLISQSFRCILLLMSKALLEELNYKLSVSMNLGFMNIKYDENDLLWSHFKFAFPLWRVPDEQTVMFQVNRHLAKCLDSPKSAEQLDLALYFMILNRHYFKKLVESNNHVPDEEEMRDLHLPVVQDAPFPAVLNAQPDSGMNELKIAFYRFVLKYFRDPKLYYFLRFLKSNRTALFMDISTLSRRIMLDDSTSIPYPYERYFIPRVIYCLRHFIKEHSFAGQDLLSVRVSFYREWAKYSFYFDLPVVFVLVLFLFEEYQFFDSLYRAGLSLFVSVALVNIWSLSFYIVSLVDYIYVRRVTSISAHSSKLNFKSKNQ